MSTDFQDVLCLCDYAEPIVAILTHRIQYEYYVGNMSVPIEGITLVNFSDTNQKQSHRIYTVAHVILFSLVSS